MKSITVTSRFIRIQRCAHRAMGSEPTMVDPRLISPLPKKKFSLASRAVINILNKENINFIQFYQTNFVYDRHFEQSPNKISHTLASVQIHVEFSLIFDIFDYTIDIRRMQIYILRISIVQSKQCSRGKWQILADALQDSFHARLFTYSYVLLIKPLL